VQYQLVDTPPISKEQFDNFMPNIIRQCDVVALVVDVCDPAFETKLNELLERLEEKRITLVPKEPEVVEDPRYCFKKTIVLAHKYLDENGDKGLARIREIFGEFTIVPTSVLEDSSMENFQAAVFKSLGIIRVYTKRIGQEPSYVDPVILPVGGTVEDAAVELHKDFAYKLQYAKVWGQGKFEGQRVKNNYVLSDGDVIEFHI
jgi:ribosome-interacting GTPase 1